MDASEIPVSINNDLEKRIADAFLIFDHQGNKTIDIREVGTVIRYLGCAPTEQEINEIIAATEMEDASGQIHLSKFLPYIVSLLNERKMEPAAPEKLLEAFKLLDIDGKGVLTKEYVTKIMRDEGEPFTQEELDEMLQVAVDVHSGLINYEHYLNHLMVYL
ncbi:dynein regulatory complex protein 8-like [Condylostylus longicornis]|uniref:dynein regulatory complex protein 8-like n=1 Tax=Condylostylus longicornis TaxID=2530218 RepID=UPI00244E13D3|nr:dynein regulatory complex protein 8-like [Condylostylus longicornis]